MICCFDQNSCLINCITLITNYVNTISCNRNLIKGSKRVYIMSLVVFDSMWMTLITILDPKESCKTNLVPQGKRWCINSLWSRMDVLYETKILNLVTSLPIYLKGRITCRGDYHFNEIILPL